MRRRGGEEDRRGGGEEERRGGQERSGEAEIKAGENRNDIHGNI